MSGDKVRLLGDDTSQRQTVNVLVWAGVGPLRAVVCSCLCEQEKVTPELDPPEYLMSGKVVEALSFQTAGRVAV